MSFRPLKSFFSFTPYGKGCGGKEEEEGEEEEEEEEGEHLKEDFLILETSRRILSFVFLGADH